MDFKKPLTWMRDAPVKWIQGNPIKTVIGTAVLLAAVGYTINEKNSTPTGRNVYSGAINSQRVVYNEGATKRFPFSGNLQNNMTVKRGETTFTFVDSYEPSDINTQSERNPVGYENDRLERIIIESSSLGRKVFDASSESPDTLYGKHVTRVLNKGSEIYNSLRTIIREDQRAYLSREYGACESELGKIDYSDHSKDKKNDAKPIPAKVSPETVEKLRSGINTAIDQFQKDAISGGQK